MKQIRHENLFYFLQNNFHISEATQLLLAHPCAAGRLYAFPDSAHLRSATRDDCWFVSTLNSYTHISSRLIMRFIKIGSIIRFRNYVFWNHLSMLLYTKFKYFGTSRDVSRLIRKISTIVCWAMPNLLSNLSWAYFWRFRRCFTWMGTWEKGKSSTTVRPLLKFLYHLCTEIFDRTDSRLLPPINPYQ